MRDSLTASWHSIVMTSFKLGSNDYVVLELVYKLEFRLWLVALKKKLQIFVLVSHLERSIAGECFLGPIRVSTPERTCLSSSKSQDLHLTMSQCYQYLGLSSKCMQSFWHYVSFRILEKQICLELMWGSRLFCSCSSCRTSLPLVRHFASQPSHLLSLRSSLESMEVCDRSEICCKVIHWSSHGLGIHEDLMSPIFSSKFKLNQRLLTKRAALLSIAGSRGDRLAPHVGFC